MVYVQKYIYEVVIERIKSSTKRNGNKSLEIWRAP